jgi:nucleotide-binding universal stress UspA family protein
MSEAPMSQFAEAVQDFRRLRRQADIERLLAVVRGESADLLPFDEVQRHMRAKAGSERQLREIPLDAIVGSVGRYHDFTRSFLPRKDSDESRWTRVQIAAHGLAGLPPIEVYQIGDAYFVFDGNHRVSVARQNNAKTIQAYVIPFRTRVPLPPDVRPDELIVRGEYAAFLEDTHLDEQRPGADLLMTVPGQYRKLRDHIDVHRYYMRVEQHRDIDLPEGAVSWYDNVYVPAIMLIRERGLLRDFPGRTEADLYLFLAEHRAELEQQLGWDVSADRAASDLAIRSGNPAARAAQAGEQMLEMVLPDELEPGPAAGRWRQETLPTASGWLFDEILVALNGEPAGWEALDQAITIAKIEGGKLYGLHIVRTEALRNSPAAHAVREEFARRCAAAGVPGRLAVDVGPVARCIRERSRWTDLVVLKLNYPPGPRPLARLKSGLRTLIRTSIRPVLMVPTPAQSLERLLLAYNDGPKAEEALFLAAYLAGRWKREIVLVTVSDGTPALEAARIRARKYLNERGISPQVAAASGPPGPAIVAAAERHNCGLIIMGGYGRGPVSDLVLGDTVEDVLRTSRVPTLICQ